MYRRKTLGYTLYTILNSVEKCSWLVSIGKIGRFQYHIALDQLTISLFWKKNALINIKRIRQVKIYFRNQLEQIRFEVRTVPWIQVV